MPGIEKSLDIFDKFIGILKEIAKLRTIESYLSWIKRSYSTLLTTNIQNALDSYCNYMCLSI